MATPVWGYEPDFGPKPPSVPPAAATPPTITRNRQVIVDNGAALAVAYGLCRVQGAVIWQGAPVADGTQSTKEYVIALAIGLCEGEITGIRRVWIDDEVVNNTPEVGVAADWRNPSRTVPRAGFEIHTGAWPQSVATMLSGLTGAKLGTYAAGPTFNWSGTAYVCHDSFWLKEKTALPNSLTFEVEGLFMDGETLNASPADVLNDLLTHPRRGAGLSSSLVDADSLAAYRAYCTAAGIGISWLIDSQADLIEHIKTLLAATNADLFWSWKADGTGGCFKVVVLADQPVLDAQGNAIWSPPTIPEYDLTPDDFKPPDGEDCVRVEQFSDIDTFNSFPVEYVDRSMGYVTSTVADDDLVDVRTYGLNRAPVTTLHCIPDDSTAQFIARLIAQRTTRCRNEYRFRLDWRHARLERGDIVTLTDSVFGLDHVPVRITAIDADADGLIEVTARDWPPGVSAAARWGTQAGEGSGPSLEAPPTSANAPVVLMPPAQATGSGRELWIAATHPDPSQCGGMELWISWDGVSYEKAGDVVQAVVGVVTGAGIPAGPPLDGTNVLRVDVSSSVESVPDATTADRDALTTLCYVGGELLSYADAALVSGSTYDLSSLRRGCLGSISTSHAPAEPFVLCDSRVFRLSIGKERLGSTVWVKTLAKNATGTISQGLGYVPATTYAIPALKGSPISLPVSVSFDGFNQDEWSIWGAGPGTIITIESGGARGAKVLRVAGGPVFMRYDRDIPVDVKAGGDVLGMRFRYRQVGDPISGGKFVSAGFSGVDADGATLKSKAGATIAEDSTTLTDYFLDADGVSNVADSALHEYVAYWQGSAGTGANGGTSLLAPGAWQSGIRYVRPTFGVNLSGGDGVVEIDCLDVWNATGEQGAAADTSGSDARITVLESSKTAVLYADAAPTSPVGGYTLRADDVWFSTDIVTNCPDANCKGHAADASGAPLVGAHPHRAKYWAHRWTGAAWVDAKEQQTIITSEIATGAVVADKIDVDNLSAVSADLGDITAGTITLNTYTEGVGGAVTRGVKIYDPASPTEPCIKVDPRGVQVGNALLSENVVGAMFFATRQANIVSGVIQGIATSGAINMDRSPPADVTDNRIAYLVYNIPDASTWWCIATATLGYAYRDDLVIHAQYDNDTVPCVRIWFTAPYSSGAIDPTQAGFSADFSIQVIGWLMNGKSIPAT